MNHFMKFLSTFAVFLFFLSIATLVQSATPTSYPMVCKGGGSSSISIRTHETSLVLEYRFIKSSLAATSGLSAGTCAWLDRKISSDEPNKLMMNLEGAQLNIELKYSNGKVVTEHVMFHSFSDAPEITKIMEAFKSADEFQIYTHASPVRYRTITRNGRQVKRELPRHFIVTKFGL